MKHLIDANDLEIVDVFLDDINGGSLITAIGHKGERKVNESVGLQLKKELDFGLATLEPYQNFELRIKTIKNNLIKLLSEIKEKNQRVQIYGASTRGATIWQYIGLGEELVESAVERQPEKVGKIFSAIGIPIISEDQMRSNPPEFLLVGPWFLRESFVSRETAYLSQGGKFIFPLPEVEVVSN